MSLVDGKEEPVSVPTQYITKQLFAVGVIAGSVTLMFAVDIVATAEVLIGVVELKSLTVWVSIVNVTAADAVNATSVSLDPAIFQNT
jgi:hypothetical protein